ncbi:dethiobiotin synthase [Microbispora sp. GKU 823]|uniref:dethiobiotin synthase n=1 Tax=Microbispora sp. GKU 823 TaxID=1652100 RepID=UPI0021196207|nr:dethiobiotin synthase [Microbispora sp. GKU 823]
MTGTDTGVGKTVVTAALAVLARERGATVAVVKPAQTGVAAGEPGDLDEVIRLSGVTTTFEMGALSRPALPRRGGPDLGLPPLSLASAAARIEELAESHRLVLVEGAGGLLVRYDEEGGTLADLARRLHAPVLVVARAALGTLNHTALTLEAMAGRGLDLAGVVIGSWPADPGLAERSNVADLEMLARPAAVGRAAGGRGRARPGGVRPRRPRRTDSRARRHVRPGRIPLDP